MAKVTCIAPVKYIQGKMSKSDSSVFSVHYGTNFIWAQRKYPDPGKATAAQAAYKAAFASAQAAVKTALADSTQRATYEAAFRGQSKYKTLRGYVFAQLFDAPSLP